jgi:23S rRNA (uracil1939-C5)-methyltransferase
MPEPTTSSARCIHFGDCGGCRSQDVAYEDQLATKAADLGERFAAYWPDPIHVTASPTLWHYRNKVEFTFARKQYPEPPPKDFVRDSVLGFKRLGKWYWTIDLQECRIGPEGGGELLAEVRKWMHDSGHRAWDQRGKDGVLRHLIVRQTMRTGERMVTLLTNDLDIDIDGFVEAVNRAAPAACICLGLNTAPRDVAMAEDLRVVAGADCIHETLHIPTADAVRKLSFRISPFAFFQTNSLATELLYGRIREHVAAAAPRLLFDLYGGSGGIALSCADVVEEIISVEEVEAATADGRLNAEANGVSNVRFETADVKDFMNCYNRDHDRCPEDSLVVIDPPRAALHPKVLRRLLDLLPPTIVYVSCNPKLLARELEAFCQWYDLTSLEAFDLFPHTPHVEALAVLVRKSEIRN